MAYTPPISSKQIEEPLKKFKAYFYFSIFFLATLILTILFFETFWRGKVLWGLGSSITLLSVIEARYFDILKKSNKQNQGFSLPNINPEKFRNNLEKWMKIEEFIQYSWLAGAILLVASKWIEY